MDIDEDMDFGPDASPPGSGEPPDGGPPGPPGGGPPGGPPGGGPPGRTPVRRATKQGTPGGPPGGDPPDEPPGAGIPEDIWRRIADLRRNWELEHEPKINKIEIGRSASVAAKAPKELDIAKYEAGKLNGVVTRLWRRLDRLEDLRSNRSDRPGPLKSRSDDSWGPGFDPGRSRRRTRAPRSDHAPSTRDSAGQSDPMPSRHSGEEERDEWLTAENSRRRDPLRTPVQPKRRRRVPEPAAPAHGRYGPLWNEVRKEDSEWDFKGPDGDPMEDFRISLPWGSASRRRREEEGYMEGVRRGLLGRAYVEEPRRGHLDFEEDMDVAAVGSHGGRRGDRRSWSLRPRTAPCGKT